jgi:phosphatidylserine/phosphatidylglycerophosphate/cardiolipin synthase-like enzyme
MGSYNFSSSADLKNGENVLVIRDRKVAVSYMIQALAMFDHYEFRDAQAKAKEANTELYLKRPPSKKSEKPWWKEDYTDARKKLDRELFSK